MAEKPPPYSPDPSGPAASGYSYSNVGGQPAMPPPPYNTGPGGSAWGVPGGGGPPGGGPVGWGVQPPQGTAMQHQNNHQQQYSVNAVNHQPGMVPVQPVLVAPHIIAIGGLQCPACRNGVLTEYFTCCGIFLALCFFPFGIICCFAMRKKSCTTCGARF